MRLGCRMLQWGADANRPDGERSRSSSLAFFRTASDDCSIHGSYAAWRHMIDDLIIFGADANDSRVHMLLSISPLLAVCVTDGHCTSARLPDTSAAARSQIVAELIAAGADPSADRIWFAPCAAASHRRWSVGASVRCDYAVHRLDEATRRALAELCVEPRRLQTLSACVVRNCLAAAEFDGVVKNADRLPLPPVLQALVKLELTDM